MKKSSINPVLTSFLAVFLCACATANPAPKMADTPTMVSPPTAEAANTPVNGLSATQTPASVFVTIKQDEAEVIVRSGPGTTYAIVGKLQSGQKTAALGISIGSEWIQIEYPQALDKKAWVFASLVDRTPGSLPVVDTGNGGATSPDSSPTAQKAARPEAIAAIQRYLKKEPLSYQYLGEDVNLNSPDLQKVDRYSVEGVFYSVDWETNWIVEIDASHVSISAGAALPLSELKQKAIQLISELAPRADWISFSPEQGNKVDIYFFRWDGGKDFGFIQVGLSNTGKVITYTNGLARLRATPLITSITNPAGLTLEEDQILGEPQTEPLTFQPVRGSQQDVQDRHAQARQPNYPFDMQFEQNMEVIYPVNGAKEYRASRFEVAEGGSSNSEWVAVEAEGKTLFKVKTGIATPVEVLRGLWLDGSGGWVLEIASSLDTSQGVEKVTDPTGQIYQNGVSLNQKYSYQEAFGYQMLDSRPFYFYKQGDQIHLSYNGQDLPLVYNAILHYGCCSNGELNPRSGPNWLNFWARRGTQWFYVQIGKY